MNATRKTAFVTTRGMIATAIAMAAMWTPTQAAAPSVIDAASGVAPAFQAQPVASRWSLEAANQLVAVIKGSRAEGLNPRDYQLTALQRAVENGSGAALDQVADTAAMMLAHDYYFGRIDDRGAMGWMIRRSGDEQPQLSSGLNAAISQGAVTQFFASLLPADERYVALRTGLADASDGAMRDRLRANMERARWMPRTLSPDYLYVNVPSYHLQIVSGGVPVSTYTVVVGAKDTPTPMMISPASSLVVNPWWNVPQSIIRKSNYRPGKPGFQFTANSGGSWTVRQPPGPRNALGRIKFNLVNDQAIYLHDTPAKAGFTRTERALSHGCIRVKDIDQLAQELIERGGDVSRLDAALASTQTATLRLPQTWPVQIVYFTADVGAGGQLVSYDDPYGYDAQLIARLDGPKVQMASR